MGYKNIMDYTTVPLFVDGEINPQFTSFIVNHPALRGRNSNYPELVQFLHFAGDVIGRETLDVQFGEHEGVLFCAFNILQNLVSYDSQYMRGSRGQLFYFTGSPIDTKVPWERQVVSFNTHVDFSSAFIKEAKLSILGETKRSNRDDLTVKSVTSMLKIYNHKIKEYAVKFDLSEEERIIFLHAMETAYEHRRASLFSVAQNANFVNIEDKIAHAVKLGLSVEKAVWLSLNNFSDEIAELYKDIPVDLTVRV